jgi:hypothetical protein
MSWNGLVLADSVGCVCLALPRWADRAYHTQHNGQWLHHSIDHSIEQFGLHPKLGFSDRIYCASLFLTADAFPPFPGSLGSIHDCLISVKNEREK